MNLKLDANSVPKLSKEKRFSLDMHAETLSVISCKDDAEERSSGRPRRQYIDNIKKWTRASLEENVCVTEDSTAWRKLCSALERLCRLK